MPALEAAVAARADFAGFVYYPASPRHLNLADAAELVAAARGRIASVVLLVDPDDALVAAVAARVAPDWLQLHGTEQPRRVADIAAMSGLPIIKALRIGQPADLAVADPYAAADLLLLDAAPPNAALPGGTGACFDWHWLAGARPARPWLLAGGLTAANVGEAIRIARPGGVDVSSGVELAPGVKSPDKIAQFVAAVRAAALPPNETAAP